MFEQTLPQPNEKDTKKRLITFATVVGVLLLATAGLLYSAFKSHEQAPKQPGLVGAMRAGTPDFDNYRKNLSITNQEAFYTSNVLGGQQIIAKGRLQNFGNRAIKGLEVRAVAYDFDGKAIAERLAAPIPKAFPGPLGPNETLPITVVIDRAPDEGIVQEIRLELNGVLLQ
jgi:hypothetical protein